MPGKGKVSGWRGFRNRAPIYDTTMVLAEKHQAFEDLHRELFEEFSPTGITEERLVQRLALLNWERDRLFNYMQFKLEARQIEIRRQVSIAQSIKKTKSRAVEHQAVRSIKEMEKLASGSPGEENTSVEFGNSKKRTNDFVEHLASLPDVGPVNEHEVFFQLVEEFPIIERLKQLEQIDTAIDRTIKRLMQLKTMKQMFRQLEPKEIPASQNKKTKS